MALQKPAGIRVLLVEDNPGDARLVREALKGGGHPPFAVVVATELASAVEHLEKGGFDVALVDLSLPDSRGLDTFLKVREHARSVPVLVLSGLEDAEVAGRAVQAGAQDYVYKSELTYDQLPRAILYALSRQQLLQQLEDNVRELRASQERYHFVTEAAQDAIITVDEGDEIVFVNSAAERLFGYPKEEMVGTRASALLPEESRAAFDAALTAIASGPKEPRPSGPVALIGRHKNGGRMNLDLTFGVTGEGRERHFTAVLRDVTEKKAFEEFRENVIDVISHEFRTPVTVIQGYGELLSSGRWQPTPDALTEARARVLQASRHLSFLLGSMAELSHLKTGGLAAQLSTVPTLKVIRDAVASMEARRGGPGRTIRVEVAPGAEHLQADERKLVMSLVELIDNAAKFSSPDSSIAVTATREGDHISVAVQDEGPGISPKAQESLFKPFGQADMSAIRKAGGAGIGLAVVGGLVRAQGGEVRVDSVTGKGTCVRILLPKGAAGKPMG
jgi:PAS domain S-box-containing protein